MQHILCGTRRVRVRELSHVWLVSYHNQSHPVCRQTSLTFFLLPSPHLLAAATQDPGGFTCAIGPPCHPGTCNQPLVHSFRHSFALLPANINSRLILQRFRGSNTNTCMYVLKSTIRDSVALIWRSLLLEIRIKIKTEHGMERFADRFPRLRSWRGA